MKHIYILSLSFFTLIYSFAQEEGGLLTQEQVPTAVISKFHLLYPKENKELIQWEYEHGGYEAYIKAEEGSSEDVAFFSSEGHLEYRINTGKDGLRTGTEKEIDPNALPGSILKSSRGEVILAIIQQLNTEESTIAYRLYVGNGKSLNYNHEGKFISSSKLSD